MTDSASLSVPLGGTPSSGPLSESASGAPDLESQLRPALEEIDRERQTQRGEFIFRIAVAVLGAVAAGVLALLAFSGVLGGGLQGFGLEAYAIPPVLAAALLGVWADRPRRRYVSAYKARVMPAIAGSLGEFSYDEKGKIPAKRLLGSTLLPTHDSYKSEDMFRGSYKQVDVELAEVKLTKQQGSGKNRRTVTIFKGLFALLSTHKAFSGKTVVRRDAGAIGNWLGEKFGGLERVRLEDPEFEQRFEVYATDQIEARYLLTPAFMERLTALAGHMGGNRLQAAFYDEQLFVMVPLSRNLFEPPSIFKSVLQDTGVARIARELGDVLAMVDVLKLNQNIGL